MLIDNSLPFNSVHTFECGQCFRWNIDEDGVYTGIAGGKVCRINGRELLCNSGDEEFWSDYFDLKNDYSKIHKAILKNDASLKKCIEFGNGIRILKQDVWEMIVSFIISANNNIPRIKKIIETLCSLYGDELSYNGKTYHSFPSAERLTTLSCQDLAPLRAGYRDKYILDAAQKVASKEVDLDALAAMDDVTLKRTLMKIKGVGGKVADCIMLFALSRYSVFPTDVWIKRILNDIYNVAEKDISQFVIDKYGEYAGFAQQYLYYYYRDNS